jgi:hypothetical protein
VLVRIAEEAASPDHDTERKAELNFERRTS